MKGMHMGDRTLKLDFLTGPPDTDLVACEAEVLGERYGDTEESLAAAYGAHADNTAWLSVTDSGGRVLGWSRLIAPGPLQLKTLADVSLPPWSIDGVAAARSVGLDPDRCWDVATIGTRRDLGADSVRAAMALYHGMIIATRVNGADWVLAIMHVLVRRILAHAGLVMHPLPGTAPGVYMEAPGFIPVYANLERVLAEQRVAYPEAYGQVALGRLDDIEVPSDEMFLLPQTVDLREAEARRA
jgi:hypothetical protein